MDAGKVTLGYTSPPGSIYYTQDAEDIIYQYGKHSTESERMDYLEFIARVTSHIPAPPQAVQQELAAEDFAEYF